MIQLCTQLLAMGYNADHLKTGFNAEMIRASADEATLSVTVANTPEHQEALQKVSTYGNKFYMTGGKHISPWTTYSLPPRCKIEREKMQKCRVKKLCIFPCVARCCFCRPQPPGTQAG